MKYRCDKGTVKIAHDWYTNSECIYFCTIKTKISTCARNEREGESERKNETKRKRQISTCTSV